VKHAEDLPPGSVPEWTLGDRLRKARIWAGLTTDEMAAELDVTTRTVTNYESDHTRPRRPVIALWALRTGVPFEWLDEEGGGSARTVPHTIRYPPDLRAIA
jgi:transcriptional regulator with XRE-family HTH domain